MSILGVISPTLIFYLILLTLAATVAWMAGVFHRRAVDGPDRLLPGQSIWLLVAAGGCGFFVWILAQTVYAIVFMPHASRAQTQPDSVFAFRPRDMALLSTAPFLIAFVFTLIADPGICGRGILRRLGLRIERLPIGIGAGLVGCLIVLPVVMAASVILEPIYDHLHYVHPSEHELLRAMGDAPPGIRALLAFGAIFCAPVWEEFLFRGHLQTIIRQALLRLTFPNPRPRPAFPIAPAAAPDIIAPNAETPAPAMDARISASQAAPPAETPVIAVDAQTPTSQAPPPASPDAPAPMPDANIHSIPFATRGPGTGVWQTWVAIVLTSAIFAVVHPLWMSPLIFVLALGLGYAYERTGSLWTSMTIHAVFNAMETVRFLYGTHLHHA